MTSSEVYEDVSKTQRSQGISSEEAANLIAYMKKILQKSLPVTAEIATDALRFYAKQSGPRKLHYFDALHIATARNNKLSLSRNVYIIKNAKMEIVSIDIRRLGSDRSHEQHQILDKFMHGNNAIN